MLYNKLDGYFGCGICKAQLFFLSTGFRSDFGKVVKRKFGGYVVCGTCSAPFVFFIKHGFRFPARRGGKWLYDVINTKRLRIIDFGAANYI